MGEFKTTMSIQQLRERHQASQQAAASQKSENPPPADEKTGH